MESATFRNWLAERWCRFDYREHHERGEGHVMVTVHREGRASQAPHFTRQDENRLLPTIVLSRVVR